MDPFYRAFEERHRGPRKLIKSRLSVYLPFVEPLKKLYDAPEVLDLGCGRGEWLELMQHNGFKVKGVDLDEGMLLACQELNLDVSHADALDYLRGLAADSLSVVSAFHVVEHIPFEALRQLVNEAYRVLKPGGLLILETPNSENLVVGTSSFYLDPTHQRPIPAQLLLFVVEYAGFERVKTLYLQDSPGLASAPQTTLINVLEGVSPDYSVIAQKKAAEEVSALFDEPFQRSYGLRLGELAERYDRQDKEHTQWLEHEWDIARQRIDELNKSTGQLEAEFRSEKEKSENLAHEWDIARQRIDELNKSTGQLEAEFRSEKEKSENLAHGWDIARQRIKELSKSTWQLEVEIRSEREKSEILAVKLNVADNHNSKLQDHIEWLQKELDSTNSKIHELSHSAHHWWTMAESLDQEHKTFQASRSWRITKPLRLFSLTVNKIIEGILAIPEGLWQAFKFPFKVMLSGLIRLILKCPRLKARTIAKLRKYPRLEAHLCSFASSRGIPLEAAVFTSGVDQNISHAYAYKHADSSHVTRPDALGTLTVEELLARIRTELAITKREGDK
ncbi:MAG: methyltransferase domain-containing protein [Methylococcales bacterium]|nr:methyltransferase domain-containing protein [Methylococcales bacterium]